MKIPLYLSICFEVYNSKTTYLDNIHGKYIPATVYVKILTYNSQPLLFNWFFFYMLVQFIPRRDN
jgi:hypothetical protein